MVDDDIKRLQARIDELESLIRAMHVADDMYGCGFYGEASWLAPYRRLKEIVCPPDETAWLARVAGYEK
jgi:hypothetical protein